MMIPLMQSMLSVEFWLATEDFLEECSLPSCARYLVVLRYGGVYADVDTECGSTLDDVIQPDDTFLAGWEDEFESSDTAVSYKFARQRQVLQWSFAASPGHPVLQARSPASPKSD